MGKVQFDWVNDGEPFEVPPMPLRGHQVVTDLKMERVEVLSRYRELLFYSQASTVLGIWKMKKEHGEEPARKAWKQAIGVLVHPAIKNDLNWDEDDWGDKFEAWVHDRIVPQVEATDPEDALETCKAEIDEFGDEAEVQRLMRDAMEMDQNAFVKEVWWRLKGKFSKITIPPPDDADEDAEPEVREFTEENLKDVITIPDDQVQWRTAVGKTGSEADDKSRHKLLEDAMTKPEEGEVQGN